MGKTPVKHTLAGYIIKKTVEQNNRNDGICWWTPETNRSGKVHRE